MFHCTPVTTPVTTPVDGRCNLDHVAAGTGQGDYAHDVLERVLYAFESASHRQFSPAVGRCRLDWRVPLNQTVYAALFRQMQVMLADCVLLKTHRCNIRSHVLPEPFMYVCVLVSKLYTIGLAVKARVPHLSASVPQCLISVPQCLISVPQCLSASSQCLSA